MMQSAAKLKDMLAENLETGTIETEIDEMLNVGTISAEIPSFTVMSIPRFIEIVSNADNFEIYPLTNGDIRLTMSFYSMLRTIK